MFYHTCSDIAVYGDPVSLVKVKAANKKTVSDISQIDIAIGKAKMTKSILSTQVKELSTKVNELLSAARKAKNKNEALSHLRFVKLAS